MSLSAANKVIRPSKAQRKPPPCGFTQPKNNPNNPNNPGNPGGAGSESYMSSGGGGGLSLKDWEVNPDIPDNHDNPDNQLASLS